MGEGSSVAGAAIQVIFPNFCDSTISDFIALNLKKNFAFIELTLKNDIDINFASIACLGTL